MATKNRLVDQKGQWKNVTPKSVKRKQSKAWAQLDKALSKKK